MIPLSRDFPPPTHEDVTARRLAMDPFVEWLLTEGWQIADPKAFVLALSLRMAAIVAPVSRVRVTLRILHPQFLGTTYTWHADGEAIEEYRAPHTVVNEDRYLNSPYAAIFQGAGAIRRRLDAPNSVLDFPILNDLLEEGATDYVAMPLTFSSGKISALTIATARPGGFTGSELRRIDDALPVIAHVFELHATRETARTILETYLGPNRGGQVLEGRIRRGDGEEIYAVIWFCDLRGSTRLAADMPRDEYIAMLNAFFECTAGPILENGGEVLNFLGDGAIGIFPVRGGKPALKQCPEEGAACARALHAAREAVARVGRLNAERMAMGANAIRFGIGLHVGDVVYGNIGVPQRLDFTVIGPAANETARIEAMCKALEKPILISAELARLVRAPLVSLGFHVLRGVREPHEIFTLAGF